MKTILLAALLLSAAVAVAQVRQPAQRRAELTQTIEKVTPDDVITLDNGESYEAADPTVEDWEGDSVTVEDGTTIVNHDKDDDAADVIPADEPDE